MSGVNLNLSTIKEVDTPKSERNLRLHESVASNNNTSLENVTRLNETPRHSVDQFKSASMSSMMSDTTLSSSTTSSGVFKQPLPPLSRDNSFTSTSTSTPVSSSHKSLLDLDSEPVRLLLSSKALREKQLKLFNASLFDYESDETQHQQQASIDYAAKIYDDLSSVNSSSGVAFKSTSFSVAGQSVSGGGKRWLDILTADVENTCQSERVNSMCSEGMQQQALSSRSTISSGRGEFSLDQTSQATNADNSEEYSMSLIQQPLSKSEVSALKNGFRNS